MNRDYELITSDEMSKDFLHKFRRFFLYSAKNKMRVSFPVKGLQQIKGNNHLVAVTIPPEVSQSWVNKLPKSFTMNSVINDFSPETGKPMKRYAQVQLQRQSIKDDTIVLTVDQVLLAKTNRRSERLPNKTEEIYLDSFVVGADELDLQRKKTFISELFKNISMLVRQKIPQCEINLYSDEDSPAVDLVRQEGRPLLLQLQDSEEPTHSQWEWRGESYSFLAFAELEQHKEKKIVYKEETTLYGEQRLIIFPILYPEGEGLRNIGYIKTTLEGPPTDEYWATIRDALDQLVRAIKAGNDEKIHEKAKVVDFSTTGARIQVFDDYLIGKLLSSDSFSFNFHFDHEDLIYTIRGRIVHRDDDCDTGCYLGIKYISFRQIPDAMGNFVDGASYYVKALSRYKQQFLQQDIPRNTRHS